MDEPASRTVFSHYRIPAFAFPRRATQQEVMELSRRWSNQGWLDWADTSPYRPDPRSTDAPYPRGGYTICAVLDEDGNIVASGSAVCSVKDAYSNRLGREIALGRALKELESCGG